MRGVMGTRGSNVIGWACSSSRLTAPRKTDPRPSCDSPGPCPARRLGRGAGCHTGATRPSVIIMATTARSFPAGDDLERHRPRLFGIAYRMLGDVQDAEDLV